MNPRIRDILDRTEGQPECDDLLFRWATAEGCYLLPSEMDTLHLFHTVRLLWNHTVPEAAQLKPFREWHLTLDSDEREEAMREMLAELGRRVDKSALTAAQQGELVTIRLKDKVWAKALAALPLPALDLGYDEEDREDDYGLDQWDLFGS